MLGFASSPQPTSNTFTASLRGNSLLNAPRFVIRRVTFPAPNAEGTRIMLITTDNEIKLKGIEALISSLGAVQAERFINLILREPFDYTEWQKKLWANKSVEEISNLAMKNYTKKS